MLSDPGAFAINPIMQPQNARVSTHWPTSRRSRWSASRPDPGRAVEQAVHDREGARRLPEGPTAAVPATPRALAGISQFGAEVYLKRAGDLLAVHVPYRGGAPMMEALAKGEADFGVAVLALGGAVDRLRAVRPLAAWRRPAPRRWWPRCHCSPISA